MWNINQVNILFIEIDVDAKRLQMAKNAGATHTLLIPPGVTPEELAPKVAKLIGGAPEHTIECSGAQFSVDFGVYVRN